MNSSKYLQIIERPLDSAQEKVCFSEENSVIAAGAGSGKTQVLATRFAYLVISKGIKVSEILTLTFTDKAASEMYQRIYSTLKYFAEYKEKTQEELLDFFKNKRGIKEPTLLQIKEYQEAEKDLTEEKKLRAKNALLDFSNAHIQTLDSYCGSIVRLCSNRYGIRPDFSVGSSDSSRKIKNLALTYILNNGSKEGLKDYCEPGKTENFSSGVLAKTIIKKTSIGAQKNYFISRLEKQKNIIKMIWNKEICGKPVPFSFYNQQSFTDKMSDLIREFESRISDFDRTSPFFQKLNNAIELYKNLDFDFDRLAFSDKKNDKESSEIQDFIDTNDFISKKELSEKLLQFFKVITGIKKTEKGYKRDFTPYFSAVKDSIDFYTSILGFVINEDSIEKTTEYFDDFLNLVNDDKRKTGMLSFSDVTSLALKILIENEDIRNQEKNAYKKIMIDEFQDNNAMNRDFLYLLSLKKGEYESTDRNFVLPVIDTDPDSLHNLIIVRDEKGNILDDKRDPEKLFFVGDEKQSIYKFKGADVSVFNELTRENKLLNMTFNYRSSPELLKAFNIFFKNGNGIFDNYSEQSKVDYEAYYLNDALKNSPNGEELPELNRDTVPLHLRYFDEESIKDDNLDSAYLDKNNQCALYTAKTIYELAQKEFAGLPSEQWKWDDFVILDRKRNERNAFTKYLKLYNIPFEVDLNKDLFEDGVINDFYNFLRLCVYPSDERACAAYLCSPLCGLSENSLETVFSYLIDVKNRYNPDTEPFSLLNFTFDNEIKNNLSKTEFERFSAGRKFYWEMKDLVLRQEITKTISFLWNEKGYKYETYLNYNTRLSSEHFDLLFEIARKADVDGKTVSWFIDELDNLKSVYSKEESDLDASDVNYPLERSHAVKIMTIHKSKGLQFKHVFIWGCVNPHTSGDTSEFSFDEQLGLCIKSKTTGTNFFKNWQQELNLKKELAEFRRLVYVAVTRAIKDVYIIGAWNKKTGKSDFKNIFNQLVLNNYSIDEINEADENQVLYKEGCSFDFASIKPFTYGMINHVSENSSSDKKNLLLNLKKNLSSEDLCAVRQSINLYETVSPSKLESSDRSSFIKKEYSEKDLYPELSACIRKYSPESEENIFISENLEYESNEEYLDEKIFRATDYGTLVHDYLCKMIMGFDFNTYIPEEKYFKNLTEKDRLFIINQCRKMCASFMDQKIYQQIKQSKDKGKFCKPEYEFKMFIDSKLIRGSIDLIFENEDGTYSLLDYKTDSEIIPEIHYKQQKCYKDAAMELIPKKGKIRCYLYYLRFNKLVEITDNII